MSRLLLQETRIVCSDWHSGWLSVRLSKADRLSGPFPARNVAHVCSCTKGRAKSGRSDDRRRGFDSGLQHSPVDIGSSSAGLDTACRLQPRFPSGNAARCTLHAARCTLHAARCTLHAARCTLHAARCTLHAARCTLHAERCTLHAARCTLHAARWWMTLSH
jgi:hypothetical protein